MTPKKAAEGSKYSGYVMILLAFVLVWVGGQVRAPLSAHHKFLVGERVEGSFAGAVVFVVRHDRSGAYGLIVNKPHPDHDGYFYGGPVKPEQISALHTNDVNLKTSVELKGTGLWYVEGAEAEALRDMNPKPRWFRVMRGYAGWDPKQLDGEIKHDFWKLVDFSDKALTRTPVADMHGKVEAIVKAEAEERAAAKAKKKADKKKEPEPEDRRNINDI